MCLSGQGIWGWLLPENRFCCLFEAAWNSLGKSEVFPLG